MESVEPTLATRVSGAMAWNLAGRAGASLLQLALLIGLARLLTPADFGVWTAAALVVGLAQTLAQLGVGAALIQKGAAAGALVSTAFALSLILGAAATLAVLIGAGPLAGLFHYPGLATVLRASSPLLALAAIGAVSEALMMQRLAFRRLATIDSVSFALGYAAVSLILAARGFGVWSLVIAQLCQAGLRSTLLITLSPPALKARPTLAAARSLLTFGAGHTLAEFGNVVANQADNLVVGRWLGAPALGLYTRAYSLLVAPARLIGTVFDKVLFPALSIIAEDRERLVRATLKSLAGIAALTLPLSLLLSVVAPEIVRLTMGPRWIAVAAPFQLLALTLTFRTSTKVSDAVARATAALSGRAWRQWVYAGLVALGAWIGRGHGLAGVAAGVSVAITLHFLLMLQLSVSRLEARWRAVGGLYLKAGLAAAPSGAVALAGAALFRRLQLGDFTVLTLTSGLAAGAYAATLALLPRLLPDGADQLKEAALAHLRRLLKRDPPPTSAAPCDVIILWPKKRQPGAAANPQPTSTGKGAAELAARGHRLLELHPAPILADLTPLMGRGGATAVAYGLLTLRLILLARRTGRVIYTSDHAWMRIVSWLKQLGVIHNRVVLRWAGIDIPLAAGPDSRLGRRLRRIAATADACWMASGEALKAWRAFAPQHGRRFAFSPTGVDLAFYERHRTDALPPDLPPVFIAAVGSDWKRDWTTPLALARQGLAVVYLTEDPRFANPEGALRRAAAEAGVRVYYRAGFARSAAILAASAAIMIATLDNGRFSGSTTVGVAAALSKPLLLDETDDLACYGLIDGINCLHFTRGDAQSLIDAATRALGDPALAEALGRALHAVAPSLSIESYADALEASFRPQWMAPDLTR